MASFAQCPNCNCNEEGTEIYKCLNTGKFFCIVCAEDYYCPHCGEDGYTNAIRPSQRKRVGSIRRRGKDDDDDD